MLRRACQVSTLSFPKDHAQHQDFRTEWWYLCGRLSSQEGTQWAYHFTIFRRALEKWSDLVLVSVAIGSKAIRDIAAFQRAFAQMLENQNSRRIGVDGFVGHLSITNIGEQDYAFFERGGTSLFNIAGASHDCLEVWVKGWRMQQRDEVVHVVAERYGFAIDLELLPLKPPVLHGNQGLSIKGPGSGEASYHYSLSSLRATGTLKWHGETHRVFGKSMLDREFGTAMLPRSVRGWDWFGLMLDNNHEIMISLIRNSDGSIAGTSGGTVAFPDGTWQCFTAEHFHVEVFESWTSLTTGARYPIYWHVGIDQMNVQLDVRAVIKEHELVSATSTTIDYWEGPVRIWGRMQGETVTGNGHVELVGYSQEVGGKF